MSYSFVAVTSVFSVTYLLAAVCSFSLPYDTRAGNLAQHFLEGSPAPKAKENDGKIQ
jgi:hypothetical protein